MEKGLLIEIRTGLFFGEYLSAQESLTQDLTGLCESLMFLGINPCNRFNQYRRR